MVSQVFKPYFRLRKVRSRDMNHLLATQTEPLQRRTKTIARLRFLVILPIPPLPSWRCCRGGCYRGVGYVEYFSKTYLHETIHGASDYCRGVRHQFHGRNWLGMSFPGSNPCAGGERASR